MPQIVKRSKRHNSDSSFITTDPVDFPIGLIALFGRRIAPAILTEIQEDPVIISLADAQDDPTYSPPTVVEEDLTSPAAAQEDLADIPPTASPKQVSPVPVPYEVDESESDCTSFVSCNST